MTIDTMEPIATQSTWRLHSVTSTNPFTPPWHPPSPVAQEVNQTAQDAIYAHLRALRTLGKTSYDVASALGIPERKVRQVMAALRDKGVRTA